MKEHQLQVATARYLDALGLLWFHPANERQTTPRRGRRLKEAGVKPGVPDCIILEPRGEYHGLAIELKVGYNKPTEKQMQFMLDMEQKGYKVHLCKDIDCVIEKIDKYLAT